MKGCGNVAPAPFKVAALRVAVGLVVGCEVCVAVGLAEAVGCVVWVAVAVGVVSALGEGEGVDAGFMLAVYATTPPIMITMAIIAPIM